MPSKIASGALFSMIIDNLNFVGHVLDSWFFSFHPVFHIFIELIEISGNKRLTVYIYFNLLVVSVFV